MVVIRLSRVGSKNRPKYQIRVSDSRRSPRGAFIEHLGYFDPTRDKKVVMDQEKYINWIKKGAQASQRVKSLFKSLSQ
ncbi:MAG: 30S ribosomal protein S16 [Bdellovibrionales bacterium]|nr:30S ribosomal protein S16 [Bdellovibrionales bacterium]